MDANLPENAAPLPTTRPCAPASLPQRELTERRLAIAQAVEVVLHGYWQPTDSQTLQAAVLRDWCDTLADWDPKLVLSALRQWRNENPNKRPNPGHIAQMLKPKRADAQPPADPEAAAEWMALWDEIKSLRGSNSDDAFNRRREILARLQELKSSS